jgi:hypothetical protein
MLGRFRDTQSAAAAADTATACLLAPAAVSDLGPVLALVDRAARGPDLPGPYRRFLVLQVIARHRAGQFDQVAPSAAALDPQGDATDTLVLLFQALAGHARGQGPAARAALARARSELESPLPNRGAGEPGPAWLAPLQARVVLAEAEALIGGKR